MLICCLTAQLSAAGQFLYCSSDWSVPHIHQPAWCDVAGLLGFLGVTVSPPESAGAIEHPYGSVAG